MKEIDLEPYAGTKGVQTPGPDDVVFTQYLRPHGQQRQVWITMSPDIKALANILTSHGYVFEIEELTNGMVSMTVEHPKEQEDGPLAHELCQNGPTVPLAVAKLIRNGHERLIIGV